MRQRFLGDAEYSLRVIHPRYGSRFAFALGARSRIQLEHFRD
jgi:hypothetical protein